MTQVAQLDFCSSSRTLKSSIVVGLRRQFGFLKCHVNAVGALVCKPNKQKKTGGLKITFLFVF